MSETRVGQITHFFGKLRVATVKVEAPIKVGDWLHVKGAHDDVRVQVKSMQVDHKPVEIAKPGEHVGIKLPRKVHERSAVLRSERKPGFLTRLLGWGG